MPRLARLDASGGLHHVMGRGIEGGKIFHSDIDRNDFYKSSVGPDQGWSYGNLCLGFDAESFPYPL